MMIFIIFLLHIIYEINIMLVTIFELFLVNITLRINLR